MIVQEYAELNRQIILEEISKGMKWKYEERHSCIHNYIDAARILRKGAISAKTDGYVIIPINMRDGIILGKGNGNEEWNFSTPHGGGRIMKRGDIKNKFTVSQFKAEMIGIYSTCVGSATLDEAPFAYRSIGEIADVIRDTVTIDRIIKPVYNFKAGGKE